MQRAAGTKFLEVHQEHQSPVTIIVILAAYLPGAEHSAWETMESVSSSSSSLRPGRDSNSLNEFVPVSGGKFFIRMARGEGSVFMLGYSFCNYLIELSWMECL